MSDGLNRPGQFYSPEDDFIIPFMEQMRDDRGADTELGNNAKEILPNDRDSKKVRRYDAAAVAAILDATIFSWPSTSNFDLPSVLHGIAVTFNKSEQTGDSKRDAGFAAAGGDSGSVAQNASASSQAGAGTAPGIIPDIENPSGRDVPSITVLAYLPGPNITRAQVIAKARVVYTRTVSSISSGLVITTIAHGLAVNQPFTFITLVSPSGITANTTYYVKTISTLTFTFSNTSGGSANTGSATSGSVAPTILLWPVWKTKTYTFVLKGQQVSVRAEAGAQSQMSWSGSSASKSYSPESGERDDGKSKDVSISFSDKVISQVLNPALDITSTASDTAIATAVAQAKTEAITGTGTAPSVLATDSGVITVTATASGDVMPKTLAATSPADIPRVGLYLRGPVVAAFKFGYFRMITEVIDMSIYA